MADQGGLPTGGDLPSARASLDDAALTLADNEGVLHAVNDLASVPGPSYFVVGAHDRSAVDRLGLVAEQLDERPNASAFRMVDVPGEWDNTRQKFCLLADLSTHVVGVAEGRPDDLLVDLGLVVATREYVDKSTLLVRAADDADSEWLPDGAREAFQRRDRLLEWQTERDLRAAVDRIP